MSLYNEQLRTNLRELALTITTIRKQHEDLAANLRLMEKRLSQLESSTPSPTNLKTGAQEYDT